MHNELMHLIKPVVWQMFEAVLSTYSNRIGGRTGCEIRAPASMKKALVEWISLKFCTQVCVIFK